MLISPKSRLVLNQKLGSMVQPQWTHQLTILEVCVRIKLCLVLRLRTVLLSPGDASVNGSGTWKLLSTVFDHDSLINLPHDPAHTCRAEAVIHSEVTATHQGTSI
jgi:hypothetical protein